MTTTTPARTASRAQHVEMRDILHATAVFGKEKEDRVKLRVSSGGQRSQLLRQCQCEREGGLERLTAGERVGGTRQPRLVVEDAEVPGERVAPGDLLMHFGRKLFELFSDGTLPRNIGMTMYRMAIGLFIPGTTNRSPRLGSVTMCGAWSRKAGSIFAV